MKERLRLTSLAICREAALFSPPRQFHPILTPLPPRSPNVNESLQKDREARGLGQLHVQIYQAVLPPFHSKL